MVDSVVMDEKAFPGGDVNTGPGCSRWVRDDQLEERESKQALLKVYLMVGGNARIQRVLNWAIY